MIALGAVFLAVASILTAVPVSYAADAERARGTVVALEWRTGHSGATRNSRPRDGSVAYAVVEFTSADGEPRTFRDSTGSGPPAYDEGERVDVLYRADSSGGARIDGFVSMWLLPLVFGGIAAGCRRIRLLLTGIGRPWPSCGGDAPGRRETPSRRRSWRRPAARGRRCRHRPRPVRPAPTACRARTRLPR